MLEERIAALAEEYYPYMRDVRHWLHRNAEVSRFEYKTAARIAEELTKIGVPFEEHYGNDTNIAVWIKGTKEGPDKTIMLRADIDALPVQEDESHELRSENPGVMHACGHDGHTAAMLGTVKILNELKDQFSGTIKVVFEAGEEDGGGARDFVKKGFLDDVEAIFGAHLFGTVPDGHMATRVGNFMSGSDVLYITIRGLSGHASTPHLAIDPIVVAAQFIANVQSVVSRMVPPTDIAVVGFSTIHAGTVFNTIPEEVQISGNFRWFSQDVHKKILQAVEDYLAGLCKANGATYEIKYSHAACWSVVNDEKLTNHAVKSAQKVLGAEKVHLLKDPQMGSESFAFYGEKAPYCFYYIGIDAGDALPPGHNLHHNSGFCWRDENIEVSMKTMAQIALDYMTE